MIYETLCAYSVGTQRYYYASSVPLHFRPVPFFILLSYKFWLVGRELRVLHLFSVKVYHGFLTLCALSIFPLDGGAGIGILTPIEHLVWIPLEVLPKRGGLCDLLKLKRKVWREQYGCYSNFGSEQ